MQPVEFMTSMLITSLRGLAGISAEPAAVTPKRLLQLYDIEGCPYCRLVREALTELNLDAEIYPCPKNGVRFRPEVARRGGKQQFPFLVDPNSGEAMFESADIVDYLYRSYGGRRAPPRLLRPLDGLGVAFRLVVGIADDWDSLPAALRQPAFRAVSALPADHR